MSGVAGSGAGRRPSAAVLIVAGALFVAGTGGAALVGSMPDRAATRVGQPSTNHASAGALTPSAGVVAGRAAENDAGSGGAASAAAMDPSLSRARAGAVGPLLSARTTALRSGRRAGWLAVIDPQATAFRSGQAAVFDRVHHLAPTAWRYEFVGTEGGGPGVAGFLAHVRLHYRLSGDTRDTVREQYLDVVDRSGHWYLAGAADPRNEAALWDLGDLSVSRGRRALVIGLGLDAGPATVARLRKVAADTDTAAGDVDAVWGVSWPRAAVVVVPRTRSLMAKALNRPEAGLDQVAAVTSGELDRAAGPAAAPSAAPSAAPAAGQAAGPVAGPVAGSAAGPAAGSAGGDGRPGGVADRVVLNPDPFYRLTPVGQRVVLTHELTHVATRASARWSPPLWVEEGFANYVAYRRSNLTPALIASDVLSAVRDGTAPAQLPVAAAFDPAAGPIAVAYADAWLAFQLMGQGDPTRVVSFYRRAAGLTGAVDPSADAALDRAFTDVLRTTPAQFEQHWRDYRAQLATAAGP